MFSDDLACCRQRFKGRAIAYVDSGNELVDLCMMSLCTAHIIANSSFSWWGAWLNPDKNKLVFAPKLWFAGRLADPQIEFSCGPPYDGFLDTRDLIPQSWTRI
jgi:hypothetical protein